MPKQCHDPIDHFMMPTVTSVPTSATYIYKIIGIFINGSLKFPVDNYILNIPTVTTVSTPSNSPYINVFVAKAFKVNCIMTTVNQEFG